MADIGNATVTYTTYDGSQPVAAIPSDMTRDVLISKASNGFIARIGCKTLVSRTWKEMAAGLELYFIDPNKAERTYCQELKVAKKRKK